MADEITLLSAWDWASGNWGLGIFVPYEISEDTLKIMVELQHRVPEMVKIYMSDTATHSKPVFQKDGNVSNPSEVIAQCPRHGCSRRFRLTLKNREKYCPNCGQALDWSILDSYRKTGDHNG